MRSHVMINEGRFVKELCHQQVHFAGEEKNKETEFLYENRRDMFMPYYTQ